MKLQLSSPCRARPAMLPQTARRVRLLIAWRSLSVKRSRRNSNASTTTSPIQPRRLGWSAATCTRNASSLALVGKEREARRTAEAAPAQLQWFKRQRGRFRMAMEPDKVMFEVYREDTYSG